MRYYGYFAGSPKDIVTVSFTEPPLYKEVSVSKQELSILGKSGSPYNTLTFNLNYNMIIT